MAKITAARFSEKPYELRIQIDGYLPKSANRMLRTHYHALHNENKRWQKIIRDAVTPFKPQTPLTKFHLELHRSSYRFLDYDNCCTSFKSIIDALKELVIEDDKYSMTGPWDVQQFFRPKKEDPQLWICVTEVLESET